MDPEHSKSTAFFDGSCALCRAEIAYYRRQDEAGAICFVDVSDPAAATPAGITQELAMRRFHVRAKDGQVLSGAAAFVEIWARLPRWRWAARVAAWPGVLPILEFGYRLFLPVRPFVSRFVGRLQQRKAATHK